MNARFRGPAEPEETGRQEDRRYHHGNETLFRYNAAVLSEFASKASLGLPDDQCHTAENSDHDSNERKTGNTPVCPPANLLKGDRIGFEEEVENAIHKRKVYSDEDQNGFKNEHLNRTEKVFADNVGEGWLMVVEERIQILIPSLATKSSSTPL